MRIVSIARLEKPNLSSRISKLREAKSHNENCWDVGLPRDSTDLIVWEFAQEKQMILITANRNMKGKTSLEQTIREKNTDRSLPVVTISNVDRLDEKTYRERCVASLIEIGLDLDNYLGTGRIFIP